MPFLGALKGFCQNIVAFIAHLLKVNMYARGHRNESLPRASNSYAPAVGGQLPVGHSGAAYSVWQRCCFIIVAAAASPLLLQCNSEQRLCASLPLLRKHLFVFSCIFIFSSRESDALSELA